MARNAGRNTNRSGNVDVCKAKGNKKSSRRLKVYYASCERTRGYCDVPLIRLKGQYLKDLGFNIGDTVDVCLEAGRIVITKVGTR